MGILPMRNNPERHGQDAHATVRRSVDVDLQETQIRRWPGGFSQFPRGFSLIEVTLALSVASFALLAILGLLQTGVTSQRATIHQTGATSIATLIFSDLTSTSSQTNLSPRFQFNFASGAASPQTVYFSESGQPTGTVGSAPGADSRYRASVEIKPPAAGVRAPTGVRILVTWPAVSDPSPTAWPTKHAGSVDTWTALDRS